MSTVGVVGAGPIGVVLARAAIRMGHDVVIGATRPPDALAGIVATLGPRAEAATATDAIAAGDPLVIVAVPLGAHTSLPVQTFRGKVVLDPANYYEHRDGPIPELQDASITSSARLQRLLPDARVGKAFNIIRAEEIESDAIETGAPGRRALPISADDDTARNVIAEFVDRAGFDPVDVGPLAESWRIHPGTPGYLVRSTAAELRERIAAAGG